jgi:preprotein translocase subunit SecD
MERSWWWKTIGVVLLMVLSVVYLLPTVVGEDRLPKWFTDVVDSRLQLGLDLQGGIHLVYEVDIDEAIDNKADRMSADLEKRLVEDEKLEATVSREGRDDILITLADKSKLGKIDEEFLADFSSNLDELERDAEQGVVRLRINSDYISRVRDYSLRQAKETIRARIDEFGVAEPNVVLKGTDIQIELPGLDEKDFDRVKRQIGRTAQLEFRIVDDESGYMRRVAARLPEQSPIKVRTGSYDGKSHGMVSYTYLESKDRQLLKDFIDKLDDLPKDREILLGEDYATDDKGDKLPDKLWVSYFVNSRTELTGEYISDANVMWDEKTGSPEVSLTFDSSGAEIFEKVSGDNVGRRMAIVLDDMINSAPVLQSRIGGGRARITLGGGGLRAPDSILNEARDLAAVLRTGALPAPLRKTFESQVGPTLGRDAIERGSLAFAIGGALVILFVLYYYRGAGLICDLALAMNFLFIAAIMSGLGATLTLPGIAGLVLTIGMAVDANVIIYERIREEAALGKTPRAAVDSGYARAFWTILDAQLTTAIAAIVLLQYGSGPIQGFAVTLLVGIVCSLFTGVVVTRLFFDFVVVKLRPKKLSI